MKIKKTSVKDRGLTFLLTGKPDAVLRAKGEVLVWFQTQAEASVNIPKEHRRFLLGVTAMKLKELEKKTSTMIILPENRDENEAIVVVGAKEGIDKAFHEIRMMSDEQSKEAFEKLEIPKIYHPFIQGSNEMLKKHAGVRINIPPLSVIKEELSIAGSKEAVLAVKAAIIDIWKDMEMKCSTISNEKASSLDNVSVSCPSWLHKYIIGEFGSGIQKICHDNQNVDITFNEVDSIKVDGPHDEVEKAKTELKSKAGALISTMAFADVKVDAKNHKYIIGKVDSTIDKIKTNVSINILNNDSSASVIRIEGHKAGVEKASKELHGMIDNIENEKEKDPDLGVKSDIVKLRGPEKDVDDCSKEMAESSYQVKVPIFKQSYKLVIGKGGANIRRIRNATDTKIDLLGPDSNMIIISGIKENVTKAVTQVQQIQSEMANITTQEINIPSKIHNTVIGAGGKLIQSIMLECGGVSFTF